jgi:hypothetical protein
MPPMLMTTNARIRMLAHADLHGEQWPEQRARHRAQRRPDREDEGEQPARVDAHDLRHLAVRGTGAHPHAGARARHQHVEEEGTARPTPITTRGKKR